MAISSEALGVQGIEMDYQTLTLFSVEEFTDLSHGMTTRSTKSKRKIDIPKDENWEETNQTPPNRRKAIAVVQECDRPSTAQTLTHKDPYHDPVYIVS